MENIWKNVSLGSISLKNRFFRSATWENMATPTGHMNDKLYKIYEELAKGEIGGIITGYANIVAEEKPNPGMMGIYDDSFLEEYIKLTESVHQHGSKIFMQLAYGGTKTKYNLGERIIFSPSDVPERSTGNVGKTMTKDDIEYIIEAFGKAALRAKKAGFDGVEIHGAHTYLINQFLSPYYNKRTDEYGGSLENRMRFLMEIYARVRSYVGNDFAVIVKLSATEFFDGGLTFNETKLIAKILEELGVDAIELSGNIHSKGEHEIGHIYEDHLIHREAYFIEFAESLAKFIDIPVIIVGGLRSIHEINDIFKKSSIEFFAFSRPLLAEPNLIKRWKEGDTKDVLCVRCSKCRTPEGNYCVIFDKR